MQHDQAEKIELFEENGTSMVAGETVKPGQEVLGAASEAKPKKDTFWTFLQKVDGAIIDFWTQIFNLTNLVAITADLFFGYTAMGTLGNTFS
jgi:hypothetical protein